MKIIKAIISFIVMVFCGMAGGQGKTGGKAPRRFGLPAIALGVSIGFDGFQWRDLAMLIYIPLFSMGYGVDSALMGWIGVEWLVRVSYALLLALPFVFYGWKRWMAAAILLSVAFQIHAGSLGQIGWFGDILIEDILRYGTLGALIVFNVFFNREK